LTTADNAEGVCHDAVTSRDKTKIAMLAARDVSQRNLYRMVRFVVEMAVEEQHCQKRAGEIRQMT
jgi:hypothetical protein